MTQLQIPLTQDEVSSFAAAMDAAFGRALESQPLHRMVCEIGGVRLGLEFAGIALADACRPSLADIEIPWAGDVDVHVRVFDSTASGVPIPLFDRPARHLIGWRGECAAAHGCPQSIVFDHGNSGPFVFDPATRTATVSVDDVRKLPYWALAAPFRGAIAMLLRLYGIELVHGAAIGRRDGVILLTGYGGSGKSTTSLSCHRRGLTVLGDDYVAVKAPAANGQPPTVHRVYSSLKVHPHEAGASSGTPANQEKVVLFPFAAADGPVCREAPCIGFWSARLSGAQATSLEARHADEVARIAAASTALQIPGDDAERSARVTRFARATSTIQQLNLGSSREGVVDAIERFLSGATPTPAHAPVPVWEMPGALRPMSVIIPVYNGAHFIAEALRNVQSQGYPDLEIIVVDDGSTDDLDAALRDSGVPHRLLRQANRGPAAARNAGIRAATGEWLAFLDADDLWTPGALRQLAQNLLLHHDASVIHGKIATLHRDPVGGAWVLVTSARDGFPFSIVAGIFKREVFDHVGGFDEELRYGEDFEWFARLQAGSSARMIPEVITHRRLHESNMTNDAAATEAGAREAWRRILTRRMRQMRNVPRE